MEGDFIKKSCCGSIFGHTSNCSLGREANYLRERLNKSEGMANEVNILTKENKKLSKKADKLQSIIDYSGSNIQRIAELENEVDELVSTLNLYASKCTCGGGIILPSKEK